MRHIAWNRCFCRSMDDLGQATAATGQLATRGQGFSDLILDTKPATTALPVKEVVSVKLIEHLKPLRIKR